MESRRRSSLMTQYLIAVTAFVVSLPTLAVALEVVSPAEHPGSGRRDVIEEIVFALRTLLLADGSDVSPRATAVLLTLAWVALTIMVVALIHLLRLTAELRHSPPD